MPIADEMVRDVAVERVLMRHTFTALKPAQGGRAWPTFDPELAQRTADWLYARSFDGAAGDGGYGPLAAAAMDIDFRLGRWDRDGV